MFTPAVLPAFALALLPGVKLRSSHPVPQHDEAVISDGFAGAVQPARVRSPSAAQDPASALDRSLAWLCAHQQSDGSFTEANEPEDASAYATLALLGSGSTSKVGLDPALMANAVSYLYQALRSDTVGFDRGLYAHVVCEALVLGCEGPDLGVLQNLLDSLANSEPASVSAAFWRGMLAASAKDCSLAVPANLRSSAMTVLQRTRSGHEAEVATAAEFLLCALHEQDAPKTKTRFTALEPSHFAKDALGLAIGAMASFQAGRITFNAWQTGVIGPRLAEQRRTGDSGCWDPAKSSSLDAVSETALVAFAAEATYRYAKIQSSD